MSSSTETAAKDELEADALAVRLQQLGPETLSPEAVHRLMTVAVVAFGRHLDAGTPMPEVVEATQVNATDAVRAASAVLKAVNLETFELALWETWGGTPWRER